VIRTVLIAAAVFTLAGTARAQDSTRTTADGVYTRQQADAGRDLFAYACQSCHAPTQHAGAPFRGKWFGRTLGDLFGYLRREMPQTDPGTMSDEEYAALTAYLMRINSMPAGNVPLAADSAALHRIRIDSIPTTAGSQASRRR
jgi:mono/diheme cytochrome c family protein